MAAAWMRSAFASECSNADSEAIAVMTAELMLSSVIISATFEQQAFINLSPYGVLL